MKRKINRVNAKERLPGFCAESVSGLGSSWLSQYLQNPRSLHGCLNFLSMLKHVTLPGKEISTDCGVAHRQDSEGNISTVSISEGGGDWFFEVCGGHWRTGPQGISLRCAVLTGLCFHCEING